MGRSRTALGLLLSFAVAGCASAPRGQLPAGEPSHGPRKAHAARPEREDPLKEIRKEVALCEGATAVKFVNGNPSSPEDSAEKEICSPVLDQLQGALEESPASPEAASLFIRAANAARNLPLVRDWRRNSVRVAADCERAAPFFLEKFQKDHRKSPAFEIHCEREAVRVYRTPVPGEGSVTGIYKGMEAGDFPFLMLRSDDGKELSFWCLEGCPPFQGENDRNLIGKRLRVFWIKEKRKLPGLRAAQEIPLFLRAEALP